MDLFEDGDEPLVVDFLVLVGEWFFGTEFFEDVVETGEGEFGMGRLPRHAVRVQALAQVADALLERAFFEGGEWDSLAVGIRSR